MRVGLGASVHRLPTDGTKEDCRSQGECILGGLKEVRGKRSSYRLLLASLRC